MNKEDLQIQKTLTAGVSTRLKCEKLMDLEKDSLTKLQNLSLETGIELLETIIFDDILSKKCDFYDRVRFIETLKRYDSFTQNNTITIEQKLELLKDYNLVYRNKEGKKVLDKIKRPTTPPSPPYQIDLKVKR